jgi:hypothetical protein
MPFHEDDIFIEGVVSGRADMTSVSPDTWPAHHLPEDGQ